MAFDFHSVEDFAKEHPLATVGIGLGTVVIIWWILSPSQTATAAPTAPNNDAEIAAAAQIGAAQIAAGQQTTADSIAANAATAQAQIAASVANAQTAAGEAVDITNSNNNAAIAEQTQNANVAASGNQAIASEFASIAQAIATFGSTVNTYSGPNLAALQDVLPSINANDQNEYTLENYAIYQTGIPGASSSGQSFSNTDAGSVSVNSASSNIGNGSTLSNIAGDISSSLTSQNANLLKATQQTSTSTALTGDQFSALVSPLVAKIGSQVEFNAND